MIEMHITVLWINVIYHIVMRNGQRTCIWPHFGLVSGTHHVVAGADSEAGLTGPAPHRRSLFPSAYRRVYGDSSVQSNTDLQ